MSESCPAVVSVRDSHWGEIQETCELVVGHPGPHVVSRDACEPLAWLSWWDASRYSLASEHAPSGPR